jgi:hypothetical protein
LKLGINLGVQLMFRQEHPRSGISAFQWGGNESTRVQSVNYQLRVASDL